jgi:SpoVK/Ycf46/Vps4 family AAA+-type ATPase
MVRSLVHSHFKKKELEQMHGFFGLGQDIINNKGRGLVILLHGVPGVGKSSTAEAVARKWGKPLMAITCGDLGLEAAVVESSLKEVFRLAQLWDCDLLLDEADVFLSQRVPSDLRTNALVSGRCYGGF